MSMGPKPEGATTIFVLGILGLVLCAPLGIFAWIQGNSYITRCRQMGVQPDGLAVAGRILGMIASVLLIVSFALCVLAGLLGLLSAV